MKGLALFEGHWRRDDAGVGAFFEDRLQDVAIEFKLVELFLELSHGMHKSGSFEKGLVTFPCGVGKLVRELEARRGWWCDEDMGLLRVSLETRERKIPIRPNFIFFNNF